MYGAYFVVLIEDVFDYFNFYASAVGAFVNFMPGQLNIEKIRLPYVVVLIGGITG